MYANLGVSSRAGVPSCAGCWELSWPSVQGLGALLQGNTSSGLEDSIPIVSSLLILPLTRL